MAHTHIHNFNAVPPKQACERRDETKSERPKHPIFRQAQLHFYGDNFSIYIFINSYDGFKALPQAPWLQIQFE